MLVTNAPAGFANGFAQYRCPSHRQPRMGPFALLAPFVFEVEDELPVVLDPQEAVQADWVHLGCKPEHIITPEDLAARLNVPDSWVYE